MSFWPNTFTSWMQTAAPVVTAAGLGVALYANWRQGRHRAEDSERAQLEAARLVAARAGEDAASYRVEGAFIRNNGPTSILDVRVWFEKHSDRKPVMIADGPNGGTPVWFVFREFVEAHSHYEWKRFFGKLPEKKGLLEQADFMVSWTSTDGVHWLLKNSRELKREPRARYIGPDSVPHNRFEPNVGHQDVFLDPPD